MSVYHTIYKEKIEDAYKAKRKDELENFSVVLNSYYNAVLSSFTWAKLPKHIPTINIERGLCNWGMNAAYMDEKGLQIFPTFPSGKLLANGLYDKYTTIAFNGETKEHHIDDICLCFNNRFKLPSIFMIKELAEKSSFALNSVLNALERSMIPDVIKCKDETQMKMLSDLYERGKNALPFRLTLSEAFSKDGMDVISFFDNRKYDVLAQWDVYVRFRNLFYSTFGINNIEILKRERLTEAEGSGNDEIVQFTFLKDMYDRRVDFVNEVKEKFGEEISVELNRDSSTIYQIVEDNESKIDAVNYDIIKGVNFDAVGGENNDNDNQK